MEFVKRHGDSVDSAWIRGLRLYEAATRASEFSAPRPLRVLPDNRSIAYASLPGGSVLYQMLSPRVLVRSDASTGAMIALRAVGSALAEMHATLVPINQDCLSISFAGDRKIPFALRTHVDSILGSSPISAMHGDFGHGNIWITKNGEVWIYDAVPSVFCSKKEAGISSIYYDIAQMISCLWAIYPLKIYFLVPFLPRWQWIRAFIAGYESHSATVLDLATALVVASHILERYAKYKAGLGINSFARVSLLARQCRALMNKAFELM
jgi:hypothetical protein